MSNINELNTQNKLFIEKFEIAKSAGKTMKELGINCDTYWAYKHSREDNNELINFSDRINAKDAEDIIKCCREDGIKEFTISSSSTGIIHTIMALEACGCRLNGTTMINRGNPHFDDRKLPAFKIEIL